MTNSTNTSLPSLDALRSLHQKLQSTLLLPGLKPLQWERQQPKLPNLSYNPPSLNLPFPEDDNIFNSLPLSAQIITELKQKYRHGLEKIQQLHRQKYEQACRDLSAFPEAARIRPLPSVIGDLRKIYESTYANRYLPMMRNEIIALRSKHTLTPDSKKVPFNAEYTPLLEKYFQFNAYPSAPDRQVLAQKTTMTPRQIEVWFQNHRKRAKENGKVINRMPPNMSHNFIPSLEKLVFSAPMATGADNQPESMIISDEEDGHDSSNANTFSTDKVEKLTGSDPTAATHVFPTRFSQSTAIYHFRIDTKFAFSPPVWPRKPSTLPVSQSEVNLDDFIATFASKLNIRDGAPRSKRRSLFRSRNEGPWFFATTTIPSCAPHPAFIQTLQSSASPPQPVRISSNDVSLLASPQPSLTTSSPPSVKQLRSPRKPFPFPKRYPSKYHPYSHVLASTPDRPARVHSVASATSFGSRAASIESMPSRASSMTLIESMPSSASWVSTLESAPSFTSRATSSGSTQSSGSRVTSFDSASSSGSSVPSVDSTPSFGSRTSSLSSLESLLPTSPTLQPQTVDPLAFNSQELQLLGDMADFDRLLTEDPQISFGDDLFSNKQETASMFAYPFPFLHNTLSSFPVTYIQAFS